MLQNLRHPRRQQELLMLQRDHEADMSNMAVGKVVFEYKEQLVAAKHKTAVKGP